MIMDSNKALYLASEKIAEMNVIELESLVGQYLSMAEYRFIKNIANKIKDRYKEVKNAMEKKVYLLTQETHDDETLYLAFDNYGKAYEYAKNAERDFINEYDPSQDMRNVVVRVEEKVADNKEPISVVPYRSEIEISKGGGEYFDRDTDPYCYITIRNLEVE